ncbi:MAG: hypothetical protein RDV48_24110 [Candidatus Eremiobacteraeota bacterium]|nr:hypothetical protein [Candidatus Eremiobacteraeota bacterium]
MSDHRKHLWVRGGTALATLGMFYFAMFYLLIFISASLMNSLPSDSHFPAVVAVAFPATAILAFLFIFVNDYWKIEPARARRFFASLFPARTIPSADIASVLVDKAGGNVFALALKLKDDTTAVILNTNDLLWVESTARQIASILEVPVENRAEEASVRASEQGIWDRSLAEGTKEVPFYLQNIVEDSEYGMAEAEKAITEERSPDSITFRFEAGSFYHSPRHCTHNILVIASFLAFLTALFTLIYYQGPWWRHIINYTFIISSLVSGFLFYLSMRIIEKKAASVRVTRDDLTLAMEGSSPFSLPLASIMRMEAIISVTGHNRYTRETRPESGYLGILTGERLYSLEDVDFPVLQLLERRIKSAAREFLETPASPGATG